MAESAVFYLLDKLEPLLEEHVTLLSGVRVEAQYIRDELERMTAFLGVADAKEETDPEIQVWVKQVREAVYDTEDVLDLYMLCMAHRHYGNWFYGCVLGFFGSIKNLNTRSQIASKIQSIKARVITIAEGHRRYRDKYSTSEQGSPSAMSNSTQYDHRRAALFLEEADLVGIDKSKAQLLTWLVGEDVTHKVVSVFGMGGLGKTTLVKKVYDDPKVKKHFQHHAWLTVSESYKIDELLKELIRQLFGEIKQSLPQDLENMKYEGLTLTINEFLRQKGYLIVFDDIWKIQVWEALRHALPKNNCGSRVMLTTRFENIASTSTIETDGHVYALKPLSKEESWTLFCKKTFRGDTCPPYLVEISQSILRRCEGLPLAIVTICGVLATKRNNRIQEWEKFHRRLGVELEDDNDLARVRKLLSLSYYDLPYYLKICFLYLSIFPEDYKIECVRLILLWTAEGFVHMKEGMTIEEVAEEYLSELVNRSLIQVAETKLDGTLRTCRVHDLLREIIVSKSKEHNMIAIYRGGDTRWPEKVRRLTSHSNMGNIQVSKSFSQLRSLLMFGVEDPLSQCTILSNGGELRLLKVLDLRGTSLDTFPNKIVKLFHLRYLSLRNTKVKVIPKIIWKLENLETMDLKHTLVTELPDGITKLQKLRHLLVYRYKNEIYPRPFDNISGFRALVNISGLTSLQKLCYIDPNHCDDFVREVGMMTQLRRLGIINLRQEDGTALCSSIEKLINLRSLSVTSIKEDETMDIHYPLSSVPRFLKALALRGRLEKLPHWLPSLHALVRVRLRSSKLRDDPLQSLEDLPNLLELSLHKAYQGEELYFKATRFQRLKRLYLSSLEGLRLVIVEDRSMPHLEDLCFRNCKLVEDVPLGIEYLTNLKYLEFVGMSKKLVTSIYRDEGDGTVAPDYWRIAHIPKTWVGSLSVDNKIIGRFL